MALDLARKAGIFRQLHESGTFVMPCAWDAGSAALFEHAGFESLGTTSGGVNWSAGRADYVYAVDRDTMLASYAQIAAGTSLPVSGDLEDGYGDDPNDVADTIDAAIAAGLVGGSIEDQDRSPEPGLRPIEDAVERVIAAREAADASGVEFTLTARAESFFGGVDDPFADAVERANRYVDAGADCIFVPGPSDLDTIARLVAAVDAPISVGIGSGGGELTVEQFAAVGVRRVSTGGALPRALMAQTLSAAKAMRRTGTFEFIEHTLPGTFVNDLLG